MPKLNNRRPLPSRQLTDLLSRALLDSEMRDKLFTEPDRIGESLGLSPDEARAIKQLDRRKFEQRVIQLRSS
jgi:hypothetical protein